MESSSEIYAYTPRQAAEIITKRLGVKLGFRKYYQYLMYFGIIDEHHFIQPPYNDGTLYYLEQQPIYCTWSGKYLRDNFKLYTTDRGINLFVSIYINNGIIS